MTMEKIKVVADFDWLENEETIGLLGSPVKVCGLGIDLH